jgi:hypothetical protein
LAPGTVACRTIRGGSKRESTTLTSSRFPSFSTVIPSTTFVPRTSASRQARIGGGTFARWIQAGGGGGAYSIEADRTPAETNTCSYGLGAVRWRR